MKLSRLAVALTALACTGCAVITRASSPPPNDGTPIGAIGAYGAPAVSANGRYVAFSARVDTRVPGAKNAVFVLDETTNTVEVVSKSTAGDLNNGWSADPAISADGRYVAFTSYADNLVPNDDNLSGDVFVRDRVAGTTTLVSVPSAGGLGNDDSTTPSISDNGRYVAFLSIAENLNSTDNNGSTDLFVRDLVAGTTSQVDLDTNGVEPPDGVRDGRISGNGAYVAYSTDDPMIVSDVNGDTDVYRRTLATNATTLVTVSDGQNAALSDDGRFIAYQTFGADDPTHDTNLHSDIYVRDANALSAPALVSQGPGGTTVFGADSTAPSLSADGRFVAFTSTANLTGTDTNGAKPDTFVRDRTINRTYLVATDAKFGQPAGGSDSGRISADGRYIVFGSANPLVSGDTNNVRDVFERALVVPEITGITPATVARNGTRTLSVTGNNFLPGARVMIDGIFASSTTVTNEHALSFTVALPANAPTGRIDVYVANAGTGPGPNNGTVGQCKGCVTVTP